MLGLLILFFLFMSPLVDSQDSGSNFYVSSRQAFSLEKLAARQKFLLGESVKNLNRDAVAGVVDEAFGFYSFVIITPSNQKSVGDFARHMLDELAVKDKQIMSFKLRGFQELPACHLIFSGLLDERLVSYEVDLVAYKGLIYQHVSFQMGEKKPGQPGVGSLRPRFRILKNREPDRSQEVRRSKTFGQVWYIDAKTYYHLGFRFKAPLDLNGYEAYTGDKAKTVHPDAFLAWVSENQSRNLYLMGSRDVKDFDSYLKQWKSSFAKKDKLKRLPGSARAMAIFVLEREPFSIQYKIKALKQGELQVLMVLSSRVEDPAAYPSRLLLQARWLSLAKLEEKTKVLRSLSFQSLLLTRDQAFNHNIYRNYHFGVRWTLSPKDLCELGFQNEKSFGTEYEVYLANHSKAYQATLELERDQLATSLEYHKEQLSRWQDVQASPTREKRGFYSTEFRVLDQPSFYLLITSKRDESYLKLLFWSQRELNSRSLAEEIRWDSRGPYQISSNYFTSDRLGFSLRKRDEDKVRVITPRELEPVGDVLEVQGQQGKQFLYCINSHFMDEELLLDLFLSSQPSTMSLQFLGSTSSDLLGLKILERKFSYRWGDKPKRLIQKTLRRGSTVFSVFTHRSPDETFVNLLHSLENRPWDSWKLSF